MAKALRRHPPLSRKRRYTGTGSPDPECSITLYCMHPPRDPLRQMRRDRRSLPDHPPRSRGAGHLQRSRRPAGPPDSAPRAAPARPGLSRPGGGGTRGRRGPPRTRRRPLRPAPRRSGGASPCSAGPAARPLRHLDDLGPGADGLLALGEAGRDHRDAHLVVERRVDHRAEDDVGVLVGGFLDDARRLLDLVDGQVRAPGEVDQDALGALDRGVVQQRARHRLLRGVERAVLASADAGAHERHAHARHDRAHVGEVEVDQPGDEDQVRDALHGLQQHGIGDLERLEQAACRGRRRRGGAGSGS